MGSLVRLGGSIATACFVCITAGAVGIAAAQEKISFSEDVMPILKMRCVECHQPGGDGYETSGLDLTSYEGLIKGTKYGPVVDPGSAVMSNFMVVVEGRASPQIQMPHDHKKLTSWEINILRRWINTGAKDD